MTKFKVGDCVQFTKLLGTTMPNVEPGYIGVIQDIIIECKYPIIVRFFDGKKEAFFSDELELIKDNNVSKSE